MDYTNDSSRTMFTKMQAFVIQAALGLPSRIMLTDPSNKALTPSETNTYFSMCNTPSFTTNDFTSISVGKGQHVWAGTSRQGIYKYNGTAWEKYSAYTNNLIWDIKADQKGGVWVAQAGYLGSGTTVMTGGINYFPDSNFIGATYFGVVADGLPSRNARGLYIDTSRHLTGTNPLIWSAHGAQVTASVTASGGIGRGFNAASPRFTAYRQGLQNTTTQSINVIGGNSLEIWGAVLNNFGKSQILKYSAVNASLIDVIDDSTNPGIFPSANFNTSAIYFDKSNRTWIGFYTAGAGLVVNDEIGLKKLNNSLILPVNAHVNANAIVGDKMGNVYIGTDSGLIIYSGGPILKDSSYKRYTKIHGLPDNNIKGICIDTLRKKLLIATSNGIIFWNPSCVSNTNQMPYVTSSNGDLNNAATWCGTGVPPPGSNIVVRHTITITNNIFLQSIRVEALGSFTVAAGVDLKVGP